MSGRSCNNCLLRVVEYGKDHPKEAGPFGFCIWFLKKLKPPKAIPADVAPVGCKNWQPGNTAKAQGVV